MPLWLFIIFSLGIDRPWAMDLDFESIHFFSALELSERNRPSSFIHPATPLHLYSAFLMSLFPGLKTNIPLFLNIITLNQIFFIILVSAWCKRNLFKPDDEITPLIFFLSIYAWPSSLYFLNIYGPDIFTAPFCGIWLIWCAKEIFDETLCSKKVFYLGAAGGLLLSLKITYLPLIIMTSALLITYLFINRSNDNIKKRWILYWSISISTVFIISTYYVFGGVALMLWSVSNDSAFSSSAFALISGVFSRSTFYYPLAICSIIIATMTCLHLTSKKRLLYISILSLAILFSLKATGSTIFSYYFEERHLSRELIIYRNHLPMYLVIPFSLFIILRSQEKTKRLNIIIVSITCCFFINMGYTFYSKYEDTNRQVKKSKITHDGLKKLKEKYGESLAFWCHFERTPLYPDLFYLHGNERYASSRFDKRQDLGFPKHHYFHIRKIVLPESTTQKPSTHVNKTPYLLNAIWKVFPLPMIRESNELFSHSSGSNISAFVFPTIDIQEINNYEPQKMVDYLKSRNYMVSYERVNISDLNWECYKVIDVIEESFDL